MKNSRKDILGVGRTWQENLQWQNHFFGLNLEEEPLAVGAGGGGWYHKDDEHCKMRQSKIQKPCQDLIYPNNYEDAPPGFEQEWGSEFMTWSELIDYNNYNCILKDLIKHTNHFH